MRRAAASLHDLKDAFRRKPVAKWLAIIAVMVALRVFGEFAVGVFDGLVAGFADAA